MTPLSELAETAEALDYVFGFWLFVLSPSYRERRWNAFMTAGWVRRLGYVAQAVIATVFGPGVAALLIWLLTL